MERQGEQVKDFGQLVLDHNIHLLTVIGEIEGHESLSSNTKTTKYEHVLPQLAAIEDSKDIQGLLVLLNTVGGDVEAGLAIAEMIASISKPSVSLVLGGSHSIAGSHCRLHRLLFYCENRDHGYPSGKNEWNGNRSAADVRLF